MPKTSSAQSTHDADVRELQRLETVWNEAHEHGDADALEKLWADDMEVAVPKMPVMTKADVLKFARSGRMKFLSYKTSDVHFRVYDNAAVVTGRLQRTRIINGQEMSDDWRFTETYVREAHEWRVVAFHASEAAQTTPQWRKGRASQRDDLREHRKVVRRRSEWKAQSLPKA